MATGTLRMIVWNVKRGNAISLHLPNGKTVMIDCGNSDDCSPACVLNKRFGISKLAWLVITHPHSDHMSDLGEIIRLGMDPPVLTRASGLAETSIRAGNSDQASVDTYISFDRRYNSSINAIDNPYDPNNMGGVQFRCFAPVKCAEGNLNNRSLVISAEYSGVKVLFMGDCTNAAQRELLEDPAFVSAITGTQILVVPHHGHESCYCPELMEEISPWICIASDAKDTQDVSAVPTYGEKCKGIMFRDENLACEQRYCLTTRNDGNILVDMPVTGGVWIKTGNGLESC